MKTIQELAEAAYVAYGQCVGFKNYQGLLMPAYGDLTTAIKAAWHGAALSFCRIGDKVQIHSFEGFGGIATIVDRREDVGANFKVRMDDGSQQPDFWAHNHEITAVLVEGNC